MLDEQFEKIDAWQRRTDERFDQIAERLDALNQRVGVLHEDVLSRIAATGESQAPTKREMDQGFVELRELIERRIDPLEAAVRSHSRRLDALEKRRR